MLVEVITEISNFMSGSVFEDVVKFMMAVDILKKFASSSAFIRVLEFTSGGVFSLTFRNLCQV